MRYLLAILLLLVTTTSWASEARHVIPNGVLRNMTVRTGFNAVLFDGKIGLGQDDVITIPAATSNQIYGSTAYSIAAWVYFESRGEGSNGRIFEKSGSNLVLNAVSGSNVSLRATINKVTDATAETTTTVPINAWHHVVMTYVQSLDGSTNIKLYVDGEEVAYASQTPGDGVISSDATGDMYVGNRSSGDRTFDGMFADFKIFRNKELSLDDVRTLYSNGEINQGGSSLVTGASAIYPFLDGSGISLTDYSGNSITATLTNGPEWQMQSK